MAMKGELSNKIIACVAQVAMTSRQIAAQINEPMQRVEPACYQLQAKGKLIKIGKGQKATYKKQDDPAVIRIKEGSTNALTNFKKGFDSLMGYVESLEANNQKLRKENETLKATIRNLEALQ